MCLDFSDTESIQSSEMGIKDNQPINDDTVVQTVEIVKRPGQTLGFYIREGNGIDRHEGVFISRIAMGSVVEKNRSLRVGDEILSVNSTDVQKTGLDDVVVMMSIPKRLILRIRSRKYDSHVRRPSLSAMEHEESPPVVVVKRCPSVPVDHERHAEYMDVYKSSLSPTYHHNTFPPTDISVDGLQGAYLGNQNGPDVLAAGDYTMMDRQQPRSRYSKDYMEVTVRPPPDYSSDSEIGRSCYNRRRQEDDTGAAMSLTERRANMHDYEEHYGRLLDRNRKLQSLISSIAGAETRTLAYNSDSEVVYRRRHPSSNMVSDSETDNEDDPWNSLPRMDRGESSDEIKHWLKKFDTLSYDLRDDAMGMKLNETNHEASKAVDIPGRSGRTSATGYSSEEYSSWSHTKSPSFQRKMTATPEINIGSQPRPRIISRQFSADASLFPRTEYVDVGFAESMPGTKYSHTMGFRSRVPIEREDLKSPPHMSRLRDLQLTRKPLHIRLDDFQSYRTERRTRKTVDDKSVGLDGIISCHILSGHGLKSSNTMIRDLYCIVEVNTMNKARTMIRTGAINFDWDEPFDIDIINARELTFLVYNWDPQARHKLCFYGVINLLLLTRTGPNHKIALRLEPKGILYFELQYLEPAVSLKRSPTMSQNSVFGVDLDSLIRREKSGFGVPVILRKCIDEVDKRGLDTVGIYRICGSAKRKLQIREDFQKNPRLVDLTSEMVSDINVVTGILKDFLRELPEPLFTGAVYQMLLDSTTIHSPREVFNQAFVMKLLDSLPKANQDTLVVLMGHLKRVVAKCDANKMNSLSLAACLGSVLLCPAPSKTNAIVGAMDSRKHVEVLRYLLDIWPDLTRDPRNNYRDDSSTERLPHDITENISPGPSSVQQQPPQQPTPQWVSEAAAQNRMYVAQQDLLPHTKQIQKGRHSDDYAEVRPRNKPVQEYQEIPRMARADAEYVSVCRTSTGTYRITPAEAEALAHHDDRSRAYADVDRFEATLPPDPRKRHQLEQEMARRHEEEMDIRRHRIEEEARRQLAEHDAKMMMEDQQRKATGKTEMQKLQEEASRQARQAEARREQTELETRRLQAEARRHAEQAEARRVQDQAEARRQAQHMETKIQAEHQLRQQQEQEARRNQQMMEAKRAAQEQAVGNQRSNPQIEARRHDEEARRHAEEAESRQRQEHTHPRKPQQCEAHRQAELHRIQQQQQAEAQRAHQQAEAIRAQKQLQQQADAHRAQQQAQAEAQRAQQAQAEAHRAQQQAEAHRAQQQQQADAHRAHQQMEAKRRQEHGRRQQDEVESRRSNEPVDIRRHHQKDYDSENRRSNPAPMATVRPQTHIASDSEKHADVIKRTAEVERAEEAVRQEMAQHLASLRPTGKRTDLQNLPGRAEPDGQNNDNDQPRKSDDQRSPKVGHRPEPDGHHDDHLSTPSSSDAQSDQHTHARKPSDEMGSSTGGRKQGPPVPPKNIRIEKPPETSDGSMDQAGQRPSRPKKTPPPVPPKPVRSRSRSETRSESSS